jgi:hypothetical protein
VLQGQDASNCLLVEDWETFHFISGPRLGYPLNYSLRLLAEQEELSYVFSRRGGVGMLVCTCPPAIVRTVHFQEEVALIVFVPNVERPI